MALRLAVGVVWLVASLAASSAHAGATKVVSYTSPAALARIGARDGVAVRAIPQLGIAQITTRGASTSLRARGLEVVGPPKLRVAARDPALFATPHGTGAYQWQYAATRADAVPTWVLRAASAITIAVIDTGADLGAPDLAAKEPAAYDVATGTSDVADALGHGTFVASLAAGSVTNGDGIAGFGGDARLLVVKAGSGRAITDFDEARAIVYAVEHGAKIINLSFGGASTSLAERRAIDYAVARGVLLVAPVGNEYAAGNPIEYPAALLQPPGSRGRAGAGLAVAGSTRLGTRARFSNTGTHLSLAAPAETVFGAVSSLSPTHVFPRVTLPGALAGLYGFGSGTSFAAPQVAGAAALVWAANPTLTAADVADVLERTAQGRGRWNPQLGFGVLDVARAVRAAGGAQPRR